MSENPEKIYEELAAYLDTLPIGFPRTKSGVELRLLKHIFEPEEAKIALSLSLIPIEPEKLWKRKFKNSGISVESLKDKLENMAKKGAIFRYRKEQEVYYAISFLAVGMFEYQLNRLSKAFADDFKQYMEEAFIKEFTATKIPQLRVIPIEESIKHENIIGNYDQLRDLIMAERGKIAVAECICRKMHDLQGYHCTHIRESCFTLGGAADYYIENGLGREISKEEALKILKKAQDEGLVLEPGNTQRPFAICTCCGCCCEVLSSLKKFEKPVDFIQSNFYSEINPDACVSCGACIQRCQMDAISMGEKSAAVNLDRCIGCGVCVPACPQDAIVLKKKEKEYEIPRNTAELYMKIGEVKNRMKSASQNS
jgi:electron transport complex protein RnfB